MIAFMGKSFATYNRVGAPRWSPTAPSLTGTTVCVTNPSDDQVSSYALAPLSSHSKVASHGSTSTGGELDMGFSRVGGAPFVSKLKLLVEVNGRSKSSAVAFAPSA